jgi:hypothetical protein
MRNSHFPANSSLRKNPETASLTGQHGQYLDRLNENPPEIGRIK